ncbi:MAG: RNA polymerase sigma factor (TIGR02999 family) [Rhodothermales bacterium]|jgi:RNA polymerase sigma factor (TIGR02999 family)
MEDQATVTQLLVAARAGDRRSIDRLFPIVYQELRNKASLQKRGHAGPATMNTTAIVHEAYIKLADQTSPDWENRVHFFAVAAKAMRHVYLDYAKHKSRQKRGGDAVHTDVDSGFIADALPDIDHESAEKLVALDAALKKLQATNTRMAQVVECRFFGGMTVPETAEALGVSPATVKRDWTMAQVLLYKELS